MIQKFKYDTMQYSFRGLFVYMIQARHLESLHTQHGFENLGNRPGMDNNSDWHKAFYSQVRNSIFLGCYNRFIQDEIRPKFTEDIVYQKIPSLRIQIPDGKGVAEYHVDSKYNHPVEELNIWLPLTEAKDTSSIYIESEAGKGDYTPQHVCYGEYITFEGGKLAHGNEVNRTGKTRVSIDFRVIPVSKFKPTGKTVFHGQTIDYKGENSYYSLI